MDALKIRSFAKLNLTFEILENLPDGFHGIRTVFQSIDLADTLHFKLVQGVASEPFVVQITNESDHVQTGQVQSDSTLTERYHVLSEHAQFPLDDNNLISKSARQFESVSGCGKGLRLIVRVDKQIPIAAGLAGGSGNAAATLRAMQLLFPQQCLSENAESIAASLGSDINFCLHGGTQVGTNRGEILQPVANVHKLSFLIVKPRHIAISTPWIFKRYDENSKNHSDSKENNIAGALVNRTRLLLDAIDSDKNEQIAKSFFNAFEQVCFESHPEVRHLRDAMLAAGCLSANITGSGPTLFGLINDLSHGAIVREKLLELGSNTENLDIDCWLSESKEAGLEVC